MDEEKGFPGEDKENTEKDPLEEKRRNLSASRARNKTVMLSPEMTGQVRALLQEGGFSENTADNWKSSGSSPIEDFLPPLTDWETPSPADKSAGEKDREGKQSHADSGPTGKFGRSEIDEMIDPRTHQEEKRNSLFDPMTSISAPPRTGSMTRAFQVPPSFGEQEPEQPSKAAQPSFTVNRAASVGGGARSGGSAGGRAPRTPVDAAPGRNAPVASTAERTKVVGFLVSFDNDKNGEIYEIRTGRWLITSRPTDHGDYILINDETVSPLHAILRATKDGKVQVLDQLSEHGTGVRRVGASGETEVAGSLETIGHGDLVRFGQRHFVLCVVPEVPGDAGK
jgi:hypothetical protein